MGVIESKRSLRNAFNSLYCIPKALLPCSSQRCAVFFQFFILYSQLSGRVYKNLTVYPFQFFILYSWYQYCYDLYWVDSSFNSLYCIRHSSHGLRMACYNNSFQFFILYSQPVTVPVIIPIRQTLSILYIVFPLSAPVEDAHPRELRFQFFILYSWSRPLS